MVHSRRYKEIKEAVINKQFLPKQALEFIIENSKEKVKEVRVNFSLFTNKKNKVALGKKKIKFPHSFYKTKKKTLVLKDGIDDSEIQELLKLENVLVVNVEEIKKLLFNDNDKLKKKYIKNISRIICHLKGEECIKFISKRLSNKSLFPNKKNNTLTDNVLGSLEIFKKEDEFWIVKPDKNNNISGSIGNIDFGIDKLFENYKSLYETVISLKTTNWKGSFFKKVVFSSTMGPGIIVNSIFI